MSIKNLSLIALTLVLGTFWSLLAVNGFFRKPSPHSSRSVFSERISPDVMALADYFNQNEWEPAVPIEKSLLEQGGHVRTPLAQSLFLQALASSGETLEPGDTRSYSVKPAVYSGNEVAPGRTVAGEKNPEIRVNSDNFYKFLNELYYGKNKDQYVGRTFEIIGMVFRDPNNFYSNQAYVGRYLMMCCASDAMVAGFYIQGDKISGFKNESWIKVRGKIEKRATPQGQVAVLIYDQIGKTGDETPYIFPNLDDMSGTSSKVPPTKPPPL